MPTALHRGNEFFPFPYGYWLTQKQNGKRAIMTHLYNIPIDIIFCSPGVSSRGREAC